MGNIGRSTCCALLTAFACNDNCSAIAVHHGKENRLRLRSQAKIQGESKQALIFRPIFRSDTRLNDSQRFDNVTFDCISAIKSSARRFFGRRYIGETTKWTISGSLYGSLRHKGLSHSESSARILLTRDRGSEK